MPYHQILDEVMLLGTNNQAKIMDLRFYLKEYGLGNIKTVLPAELGLASPKETEDTFEGNSNLKAKYYGELTNLLTLSDDTGICIDALDGRPGVNTADWAVNGDFKPAFQRIKDELRAGGHYGNHHQARAVCVISVYCPKSKSIETFRDEVEGTIDLSYIEGAGIGFQPIFIPANCTIPVSEMPANDWMEISHRARAFKKLMDSNTLNQMFY